MSASGPVTALRSRDGAGALLGGTPAGALRALRLRLPFEGVCLGVLAGLLTASALGMALASFGLFRVPFLLAVALAAGAAGWLALRSAGAGRTARVHVAECLTLAGVIGVSGAAYLPPAEFVLGGWDSGVYVNAGASLARTGGFVEYDALLDRAGPQAVAAVSAQEPGRVPYIQPGLYLYPDAGHVVSHFPYLLTMWNGVVAMLAGIRAELYLPPAVAALAGVCFFLLARRLAGPLPALAGTVVLMLHPLQVWHGRSSFSEQMVQVLLLGGLWAGIRWLDGGRVAFGLAAALALALLPLAKTEGVLLSISGAMALTLAWGLQGRHRRVLPLLAVGGSTLLLAALFYATIARPMVADQIRAAGGYAAVGALVAVLAVMAAALAAIHPRWVAHLARVRLPVPAMTFALGVILGGGAAAAWFTRASLRPFAAALFDGLFLSPIDLVLLAAGLAGLFLGARGLLAPRSSAQPTGHQPSAFAWLVVIAALGAASIFYLAFYWHYVQARELIPLFMWATRRLVPAVLPLVLLIQVAGIDWLIRQIRTVGTRPEGRQRRGAPSPLPPQPWTARLRPPAPVMVLVLALLTIGARWPDIAAMAGPGEYAGALAAVEELGSRIEREAVVLLDPDDTGVRFAAPLRSISGRPAYILWRPEHTDGVRDLVEAAGREGRPVYYLASSPGAAGMALLPYAPAAAGRARFTLYELERTSVARPALREPFQASLALFRLQSVPQEVHWRLPITLDLGAEQFPGYALLRDGFYPPEDDPRGAPYRWTKEHASLTIPEGISPRRLMVSLAGGRPAAAGPASVVVGCGDVELGRFPLDAGFQLWSLELNPACLEPHRRRLDIRTAPWRPDGFGVSSDRRSLGVMVRWIALS